MGRLLGPTQGLEKIFAHRKQTKKQKLKIATMALEWVPVIYLGVISLDSKFQLSRSSDN